VDDDKRPVGVENPLDEEERLCSPPRLVPNIEIDEPLPKAVDEVMLFLKKHALRGAGLSEVRRKDVWSIPLGILRETIINAIVHADYSQRGAPIRIAGHFTNSLFDVAHEWILRWMVRELPVWKSGMLT